MMALKSMSQLRDYRLIRDRLKQHSIWLNGKNIIPKYRARQIVSYTKIIGSNIWQFNKKEQCKVLSKMHNLKLITIKPHWVEVNGV